MTQESVEYTAVPINEGARTTTAPVVRPKKSEKRSSLVIYRAAILTLTALTTRKFEFSNPLSQLQLTDQQRKMQNRLTECIINAPVSGYMMNYKNCWQTFRKYNCNIF